MKDNNDGTITDEATGLMWQKDTPKNALSWEDASQYCKDLTLAEHSDWRLPTIQELLSIVDYTRYGPAINIECFPGTASSFYWSSTTYANYTDGAWGVDFYYGHDYDENKLYSYYVRAVRRGTIPIPVTSKQRKIK